MSRLVCIYDQARQVMVSVVLAVTEIRRLSVAFGDMQ